MLAYVGSSAKDEDDWRWTGHGCMLRGRRDRLVNRWDCCEVGGPCLVIYFMDDSKCMIARWITQLLLVGQISKQQISKQS